MATVRGRLRPPAKIADPFYLSPEWKQLASDTKRQRGYRCDGCDGDFSKRKRQLIADHIIERKDGGAELDPLNIQCLCMACHNKKTAHARLARADGRGGSKV